MEYKFDHGSSWTTEKIIAGLITLFGRSPDRIPSIVQTSQNVTRERMAIWLFNHRQTLQHCSVWRWPYYTIIQIDNLQENTPYRTVIGTWFIDASTLGRTQIWQNAIEQQA